MKDVYGQALAADTTFDLETELPYTGPPQAPPAKKAAHPATKPAPKPVAKTPPQGRPVAREPVPEPRPHRPRLPYDLQLGVAGHLVEALATTGTKAHKVPVGSVNIATYELSQAPLNEAQTLASFGTSDFRELAQHNHIAPTLISCGPLEHAGCSDGGPRCTAWKGGPRRGRRCA